MKKDKTIKLYVYVDGVNDVPFYGSDAGEYEAFILANGEQYTTSEGFVFNVRNVNEQIELGDFRYDAKRMGGAPTITCTLMYEDCLDDFWSENVYAKFNGEKYFLKQTPTSSYSNESTMYKHDLELVSERVILDNVYFFDAVVGDPQGDDKPVSNSTKVVFFGNIHEFVKRLNSSLEYAKLLKWEDGVDDNGNAIKIPNGYHVVVDDDNNITTEEKLMSFEDQFFSNVLQEIYNTYEVPYYFEGKTIHIGYSNKNAVVPTFSYGVDDALLSITKNNANYKIVNRATATGSSDNIPFYYPNNAPNGEIRITASESNQGITTEDIEIRDIEVFSQSELRADEIYTYHGSGKVSHSIEAKVLSKEEVSSFDENTVSLLQVHTTKNNPEKIEVEFLFNFDGHGDADIDLNWSLNIPKYYIYSQNENRNYGSSSHLALEVEGVYLSTNNAEYEELTYTKKEEKTTYLKWCQVNKDYADITQEGHALRQTGLTIKTPNIVGVARIKVVSKLKTVGVFWESLVPSITNPYCDITYNAEVRTHITGGWKSSKHDTTINMDACGIRFLKNPVYGDSFSWTIIEYIKTATNLQPSIYRDTKGAERFYNAINYPFDHVEGYELQYGEYVGEDNKVHNDLYKKDDGTYMVFPNPYVEGKPKEHIFTVEDIKPTIKETEVNGLRIDMFSEFAYDLDDNDELIENEEGSEHEYVHSYFFAKLRKLDFNLFDHAIENQPMTISFTSGDCGACNFEIGVTEEFPQKNPVQVNADGTLKRDEKGRVICGQFEDITEDECQPQQQDTINNEVWIALKKEETTYGILMPKAPKFNDAGEQTEAGHRPKACTRNPDGTVNDDGDTFVILGINLPQSYITNAEKKLESEIIKYLQDNNDEKFTFSIGFSRIYFEENNILDQLSENSKIAIMYNGQIYDLYVSSFSYSMSEGDVLPEIRVELDETLKVSQNALQNAISQVKSELGRAIGSIDVVGIATPYFIRKDADDEAQGRINFKKGIKFGEGGKVEIMPDNGAKLTIDYLEVSKKATFNSLEIAEKKHVGGQILLTPAAMKCGEVEEFDDYYRCYFQTMGEDGDEIFNQFAVGDQAICQTYNAWGSRYYWRLVVGIGEDYIDLSKTDCDEYSDIPSVGDSIILLGNRTDITRQSAIVLSAYDDDAPSLIMYNGINSYSLVEKNITGIIWNPETKEPQMYSYGSFFFGDRQLNKNFITFQKKEGDTEKELFINANIQLGAGSSGLTNLAEWSEKQGQIDNAQDTADQKRRIFVTTPYTPYEVGDMWTQGDNGDIMRCIVSRLTGSYQASDWDKASKYTDDTTAQEAKDAVSDLEYIKTLFPSQNIITNGAVLSSLLGVKDDNDNIVAGLSGTDLGKDTNHGKALVFAGSTNLNNISGAKTKIYEDGTVETNKLIAKDGCKIGAFEINNHQQMIYSNLQDINKDEERDMLLHTGGMEFERTALDGHTIKSLKIRVSDSENIQVSDYSPTLSIYQNDSLLPQSMAALSVQKAADGLAISVPRGQFAGLRPMARTLSGEKTLTPYDHTIFASDPNTILNLPSTPQEGQEYIILVPNGGVNILGNGKQMYLFHDAIIRSSYTCGDLATRTEQRLYWNKADDKWWVTYIKF